MSDGKRGGGSEVRKKNWNTRNIHKCHAAFLYPLTCMKYYKRIIVMMLKIILIINQ